MSINSLLFAKPTHRLPRLLLLDAKPEDAAAVSLAMGAFCMPFSFGEIYRAAVAALLNEAGPPTGPREADGGTFRAGGKTYLKRNLEVSIEQHLRSTFGDSITADLMAKRLHEDMPYFACCSIEDAALHRESTVRQLVEHLLDIDACAAHEIVWMAISDTPHITVNKFPDWTLDTGIRIAARASSDFTTPAEILSALETL